MPQVTVYIRKEDLAAWEGVKKKSEFMHNALVKTSPVVVYKKDSTVPYPSVKAIRTPEDVIEAVGWQGSNFKKGKK